MGRQESREFDKKEKKSFIKRIILGSLAFLLIFFIGIFGYFYIKYGSFLGEVFSIVKDVKTDVIRVEEPINVLLLGMDIGDTNDLSNKEAKRTDTIILANFDPVKKDIKLVSVPRDTRVKINGRSQKINAAYPIGGERLVKELVGNILGVKVDYVVKIDYEGFRGIVDALGGVDMYIDQDMNYDDPAQDLHIHFNKGETVHLDGKKAEEFFRWRKNNDGTGLPNGDIDRIKNQHEFLAQVVKKCATPAIIFKMPKILKVMERNIETNMPGTTIFKYVLKLMTLKAGNINMTTIKGTPQMISGQSYFVFNKQANQQLINSLNSNGDSGPISPQDVRIKVLNGTKISGLAATYKVQLNQLGYTNVDTGNTNLVKQSVVMVNNDNIKSELQKKFTAINKIESIDSRYEEPGYDVIIVLGDDAKNY